MHSHHAHRAHKVSKSRVKHIMHGHKRGGGVHHDDEAADRKLFNKLIKEHHAKEHKVEGHASGGRLDKYARGGKTKGGKGKHHTQVNIAVVSPHGGVGGSPSPSGASPAGLGLPGGGPPRPPMPPGPPPGAMPPGGPPGMPPGMGMKPPGMMKRGGKVTGQKGGADTGVGRLDKAKMYGMKKLQGH